MNDDKNIKVSEIVNQLEKRRKNISYMAYLAILIGAIAFILLNIVLPFGLILLVADILFYFIYVNGYKSSLSEDYKLKLVEPVLNQYFDDVKFDPENGIPKNVIDNMDMMCLGNLYSSNDLIDASYKGVHFITSDVYIADQTTDSEGNTSTDVMFNGRWMIFDFNKKFKSHLQVKDKSFANAKRTSESGKMEKIKLENELFNKYFRIFASSDLEAFYILTPHIMDRMLSLREKIKAKMMFCFDDNKLHIAINSSVDSFELKTFKKITPELVQHTILSEIVLILDFIDELQLDKKIWNNTLNI
ncbi:DUF3137 domain-containing protein [Eubacteriales bacterium OttesenSCG-928-G02]|nr:DUF3137 domain-containing protein [Eubacteriales bacterium OttesenSCG-928-G02]